VGRAERVREPMVRGGSAIRTALALTIVAAGVVLLATLWMSRREAAPVEDASEVVKVGVVQGQPVGGYLQSSHTELAALTDPSAPAAGDTWALISLDDYVSPGRLPTLLEGTTVAQVYTRVPLAAVRTQVVRVPVYRLPADVLSGMLDAALQRDREQAEYQQLARRLNAAGATQERARRAYETAAGTAGQEAAAYRSGCSCVFAAVVRATPAVLRGVGERAGVRVVDPAPEVRRLDRTEFRPPLPEQTGTIPVEPGRSPAVPNGDSGIATRTPAPILSSLGVPVTSASPVRSDSHVDPSVPAPEERAAVPSASNASAGQGSPSSSSATP
jgi:hypothetical protein